MAPTLIGFFAGTASRTALYVAPGGRKKRSRQYEEANLKDIVELAESYKLELRTAVRANVATEEGILKELAPFYCHGRRPPPGRKTVLWRRSLLFVAS